MMQAFYTSKYYFYLLSDLKECMLFRFKHVIDDFSKKVEIFCVTLHLFGLLLIVIYLIDYSIIEEKKKKLL